jgi:hypothetical protein
VEGARRTPRRDVGRRKSILRFESLRAHQVEDTKRKVEGPEAATGRTAEGEPTADGDRRTGDGGDV